MDTSGAIKVAPCYAGLLVRGYYILAAARTYVASIGRIAKLANHKKGELCHRGRMASKTTSLRQADPLANPI
jgi:hypothetical protein